MEQHVGTASRSLLATELIQGILAVFMFGILWLYRKIRKEALDERRAQAICAIDYNCRINTRGDQEVNHSFILS
jgi:hypothetical protein